MIEPPNSRPANALFNPAIKRKISKLYLEKFLGEYDVKDYIDFIEILDRILGKSRLDILSSKTFDRVAKQQIKYKTLPPVLRFFGLFFIAGGSLLALGSLSNSGFLMVGIMSIIAGIASIICIRPATKAGSKARGRTGYNGTILSKVKRLPRIRTQIKCPTPH